MSTRLQLDREGGIARLTLHSDDGANRIDAARLSELREVTHLLASDESLRVLVVCGGGGRSFCLGWSQDLLQRAGSEDSRHGVPGDPFACLAALRCPVIAEINGDAFSAGLELALACDLRFAAEEARFAFPETSCGLIPLAGGTQRLPRVIGRPRALSMIMLGQVVDARTALDWGLVNTVTPAARLHEEVERIAGVIAARGPIAERFAKEAVLEGIEMPLARALRYELDLTVLLQTTEDRAEGVRAFSEKRPPRFLGR